MWCLPAGMVGIEGRIACRTLCTGHACCPVWSMGAHCAKRLPMISNLQHSAEEAVPPWKPVSRSLSFSPPLPGHALPCYPGVLPAPSISTVFLLLPIKLALYCDPCLHTCRVCLSRIWLGHDCAVENRMKCQTPRVESQLASKTENGYLFSPFEGCL